MIRLTANHGYKTSRDYELLADLMKIMACVCFVGYAWPDGDVTRDVGATIYWGSRGENEVYDISCRGTSYAYVFSREDFIACCQKYNVEFIVPEVIQ